MADLRGVNLAMQTPFDDEGRICLKTWEELIDRYVDAGVHGLVLGSGTGQHPYLTEQECNRLYEVGAKRIAGRCNVICQTSALNVDEVIRRSRHAEAVGASALMVLPPYLEGPADDDGLLAFYEEIDRNIGIDFVGYNIPQATGVSVGVDLLKRLNELEHFGYIKDSAGDFTVHQAFLLAGGKVLNGCDTTTVYALMAGAHGAIWGGANYMPHEAVRLYDLVKSGDHAEALRLWARMLPSLLYTWQNRYMPAVLFASKLRGFGTGNVRRPLSQLNASEQDKLRVALSPLLS